jgi:hypothetical protein
MSESELKAALMRCARKLKVEYDRQQPDAAPDECWAEAEAAWDLLREPLTIRADEIVSKQGPVCEVCGKRMWWHGSTFGWGCPMEKDKDGCLSMFHRNRWP